MKSRQRDGENLPGFVGTGLAEMGPTPLTRHAPGRNMKEINMIRNIAAALSAFALASFGAFAQTGSTGSTGSAAGSSDTSATTTTKSDSTGNMKHSKKSSKKASKKASKKSSKKASGDMGATGSSTTNPK
jgi:hypothetical protein